MKPLSISLLYQLWKKTHLGFWGTNFPRSEASPDMRMQFSRSSDVTFLRACDTCDVQAQGLSTPLTVYILKMCNPGKYDNLTADMATRKQKVTFLPTLTRNCTTFLSSRPSKKFSLTLPTLVSLQGKSIELIRNLISNPLLSAYQYPSSNFSSWILSLPFLFNFLQSER